MTKSFLSKIKFNHVTPISINLSSFKLIFIGVPKYKVGIKRTLKFTVDDK